MPTYFRRDDFVESAIGYAIPNVAVTYYLQPGLTLAAAFSTPSGTSTSNPQLTDGLGHAVVYLAAAQYTITYSGAQIQTLTLADQNVGGSGSGSTVVTFQGVPQGTVDGVNRVFTLTNLGTPLTTSPTQVTPTFNGTVQVLNASGPNGYTISGVVIVFNTPPQPAGGGSPADVIYAQGVTVS
jgi:hypothetical protein